MKIKVKKVKEAPLGEPFIYEKHKGTKAYGDIRFRFYACGFTPDEHNQMIFVKYKPTSKQTMDSQCRILSTDIDHVHFDFPDREILITKNNFTIGGSRPFNDVFKSENHWHKAVSLTPMTSVADDLPFDRYMINPHAYTDNTEPKVRAHTTEYNSDKICIADSSAFQLGHGFLQFIDPDALCNFYDRNADEGVVLDIPTRHLSDKVSILKHTAKLQNLNTRYMKKLMFEKHGRKDFRFATVFHGLSMDSLEYFRNKIEEFDDDFPIVCISGAMRFNVLESVHRMLKIILRGKTYPQYHLLGVGHPVLLSLVIWMSYLLKRAGKDILITSDASSAIMLSAAHTYFSQSVYHEGLNLTRFGLKMDTNKDAPSGDVPNPYRRIQTLDPIAEIVGGYQDVISSYNIAATRTYIKYVNHLAMIRYFNMMSIYANTLDYKAYKELILEQYKRSTHVRLMSITMDYLQMVFEGGMDDKAIDKAYAKYKFYMPTFSGEATLHTFPAIQEEEEKDAFLTKKRAFVKKHLITVINNYYEFHRSGKRPKSFVNMDKKEFDLSNAMRK